MAEMEDLLRDLSQSAKKAAQGPAGASFLTLTRWLVEMAYRHDKSVKDVYNQWLKACETVAGSKEAGKAWRSISR